MTVGQGRSPSFRPSMTRWPGTADYLIVCSLMLGLEGNIFDLLLTREAVAEMRNKELAATNTLLNDGEQVLLFVIFSNSANINILPA